MDITSDVYHQFMQCTLEGDWESVIEKYKTDDKARWTEIGGRIGTALHVAAKNGYENVVKDLIEELIRTDEIEEVLNLKNDRGNTPLHFAAYGGFKGICKLIIGENDERKNLIEVKNKSGETPLFLAALSWKKHAFAYLFNIVLQHRNLNNLHVLSRDSDRDTILHTAIRRDFFDLAIIIIHHCPELSDTRNKNGITPLKLLAERPSAFKSGSNLAWWKEIIYHCTIVHELNPNRKLDQYSEEDVPTDDGDQQIPKNYLTCYQFILWFAGKLGVGECKCVLKNKGNEDRSGTYEHHNISIPMPLSSQNLGETSQSYVPAEEKSKLLVPPNYATCGQFVKDAYFSFLVFSGAGISDIGRIKQKHIWSDQLLRTLMLFASRYEGGGGQPSKRGEESEHNDESNPFYAFPRSPVGSEIKQEPQQASSYDKPKPDSGEKNDGNETVFLTAARNGIVEIVKEVLSKIPSAIHDTTIDNNMNVFHMAVKNRQPRVVEALRKILTEQNKIIIQRNLIQDVDNDDNTVLHMAAGSLSSETSWKLLGSAMQMIWDITWLQYVKKLVPDHFVFRRNVDEKTPVEIFKESHKELVKESSEWLKSTSESCSVVAALIAGVSFATVGSVPGGSDNGKPALKDRPAFEAFAISSLVGLFFSVTALIMFLSIIISRKQATDFRRSLPWKLLLGLTSLFLSIAAMFISFCAGHFFVLNDRYKQYVIPFYIATCLPVTFYAVTQFPLYLDLLKVIYRKVPRPSDTGDDL